MLDLLSKLSGEQKNKPIEPREIFMSLPSRGEHYDYPRDVQAEVWEKWFDKRNKKNNFIKMNTGSGKTVVALMMLQSCLHEGKGPVVYVVPDNYLVSQVQKEAANLGILVVTDADDYNYTENKAILIINIHKLVNGRSVFGMNKNYPIGSVLIDDVHACLDTITTQFSLQIPAEHELYLKMIEIFGEAWKSYNSRSYADIMENPDPRKTEILPFWIWQDCQEVIYNLLRSYENDNAKFVYFNFPLIKDCLSTCSCVITTRCIEIMPKGIPISNIDSFENAERRIFMSATLADDGVFVSALGVKKDDITDIITPERANDIGDRLILFPTHLNNKITDDEIKEKTIELSETHNVVVIVPSYDRALYWDESGTHTAQAENIDRYIAALRKKHIGLIVLVNRYDGIDLPNDACRVLVIDGLPPLRSEYDKYVQTIDSTSDVLLREQVQKIEQGMGRGVRSNRDSCCVVLMGNQLADVLIRGKGVEFFSNATREQFNLSKDLWDLLKGEKSIPTVNDIFELANYSLNREIKWIKKSKERLSEIVYKTTPNIAEITCALRGAYEQSTLKQWKKAVEILDEITNATTASKTKGFLMQINAEYMNFIDRSKAQQILKSARNSNSGVLAPIDGIQYDKLINNHQQAKAILDNFRKISPDFNNCVLCVIAILDDLTFSPNANGFESATHKLGKILGFESSRPEREYGRGPDNLWALGNNNYFVIECKSGTTTDSICKHDCNQLNGSTIWFESEYSGNGFSCTPIMIHNAIVFNYECSPHQSTRIMNPPLLDNFKKAVRAFIHALAQSGHCDESKVNELLVTYKLRSQDIINEYTMKFSVIK